MHLFNATYLENVSADLHRLPSDVAEIVWGRVQRSEQSVLEASISYRHQLEMNKEHILFLKLLFLKCNFGEIVIHFAHSRSVDWGHTMCKTNWFLHCVKRQSQINIFYHLFIENKYMASKQTTMLCVKHYSGVMFNEFFIACRCERD